MSPATAEFLKEGIHDVLATCSKNGMNEENVNKYIQDFIEDAMSSAPSEDKKTLDAMKVEIGNTKKPDEMAAKIKNMVSIAGAANGEGDNGAQGQENQQQQKQAAESRKPSKCSRRS